MFIHISFREIVRDQVRGVQQNCQPNQSVETHFDGKARHKL